MKKRWIALVLLLAVVATAWLCALDTFAWDDAKGVVYASNGEAEAPKDETPKDETPKDETPKDETPKDETPKDETPKDETPKDETPKDESP